MRTAAAALVAFVCASGPVGASQPQTWKVEGAAEFLAGQVEGLSVDSEGRLRLAPATALLADGQAPHIWCVARDSHGSIYAGTGTDGKVLRVRDGKVETVLDAPELEIHALALGPDGTLYAGSSPDGKVYSVDRSGKSSVFFDPPEKYIWALAFDASGRLLVGTGADGKVHRVDAHGKAAVLFASTETHILALAVDPSGSVYAGSAPGGILYRIDDNGKVFVVYDSAFREVKSIAIDAKAGVFAALVDRDREERPATPPPQPAPTAPAPPGTPEVTVTETFAVATQGAPQPGARPSEPSRGPSRAEVIRVAPSGEIDTLWSSPDEMPHALVADSRGVVVATGNKGRILRVNGDRTWSMLASLPSEQATSLCPGAGGALVVATSNPGRVHSLEAAPGPTGTFTSEARDARAVARWGRIRWDADVPAGSTVTLQTRSGNTSSPDTTWTDWSSPYTRGEGEAVRNESARFLQVRVTLSGGPKAAPSLDGVSVVYLPGNLRPQVSSLTVHPPGEVFQKPLSVTGEIEILGLDPAQATESRNPAGVSPRQPAAASPTTYSRRLFQKGLRTFVWRAEDPDGDELTFDVHFRPVGDERFRLLRRGLTEPVLAWDTTSVPDGRYVLRITALDAPDNPVPLSSEKASEPFEVDNTPPKVTAELQKGRRDAISASVRDALSPIRRAEYAVDGGAWRIVSPADGISDSPEERYDIQPAELGAGQHVVIVRAWDQLGNVGTARIDVP
jgi:sugar lactone lactonase YvrE